MEAGTVALLAYLWKHSNDGPRSRDLSLSPDLAGFENKRDKEEVSHSMMVQMQSELTSFTLSPSSALPLPQFTSLSVRDPLNAVGAKVGTLFAEGALGAAGLGALAYGSYQSLKKAKAKLDQLQQRDLPSPNGVKLDDDELWAYQKSLATGKKLENIWEKTKVSSSTMECLLEVKAECSTDFFLHNSNSS